MANDIDPNTDLALIKRGILKLLQNSGTLVALVGTKIYVEDAKQAITPPFVVFRRISESEGIDTHGGVMGAAEGLFQIDCFSDTPAKVEKLSSVVKQIFHGFSGTVEIAPEVLAPPTPAITITIYRSLVVNRVDLSDPDLGIYRIPVDVRVRYKEF